MEKGVHPIHMRLTPVSSCLPCDLRLRLIIFVSSIYRVYKEMMDLEPQIMESCENGEWTVLLLWSLSQTHRH